ncbi:DUF971 domain-containing protein [Vulgatibacter incomptus]|uniref:Gamma-butyrobetaine hydroxylase-like N-terminal domain-containing protein n=1 Tax=Vulgatibacter incomptus TaxID=1391653 RepID=A0A0K1P886_9BACT|nr:DUF971 domain-containing protein [Vulgatibacter incomptus]AKU89725.1 hypothetical protein AKJ08_0112 [Vulgatibacter incomptus]
MFWDKLKPSTNEPKPISVDLSPTFAIQVTWDDWATSRVPAAKLRLECPCAACVDEWTGARLIDPTRISPDVRPVGMEPVGNYAVQIRWSDGHETGLYSWRQLRTYVEG